MNNRKGVRLRSQLKDESKAKSRIQLQTPPVSQHHQDAPGSLSTAHSWWWWRRPRAREQGWYHHADLHEICHAEEETKEQLMPSPAICGRFTVPEQELGTQPMSASEGYAVTRKDSCYCNSCVKKRWKIKPHFPKTILALHTCSASVACGHCTSFNRVKDRVTLAPQKPLPPPGKSIPAWAASRSQPTQTHGAPQGWGLGQTKHQQIASSSLDTPAGDGSPPNTLRFHVCHTWNFSGTQRREAAGTGSLCWPLLLEPTTALLCTPFLLKQASSLKKSEISWKAASSNSRQLSPPF